MISADTFYMTYTDDDIIWSEEMNYGEILRFYGNQCVHYNEINDTGNTRVSIDFRVIPFSMWDEHHAEKGYSSVKSGMRFTIGDYYDVCPIDFT